MSDGRRRGRGRGRRTLEENIIERLGDLRVANIRRTANMKRVQELCGGHSQQSDILGGYIRSYEFNYVDGATYAQGSISIQAESNIQHEATFIILEEDGDARNIAQRIFDDTDKFSGYGGVIANIYLAAYCDTIGKWVIGYEKFNGYLYENNQLPPFYESINSISKFWKDNIRQIVESLSDLCTRYVVHGGLSKRYCYVIDSNSNIKLINISRYSTHGSTFQTDIVDFFEFFSKDNIINASGLSYDDQGNEITNDEWKGFYYLIKSNKMSDRLSWKNAILGHPILLDPPDILTCYLDVHNYTHRLKAQPRADFANALYCKMPHYFYPDDRGRNINQLQDYTDPNCPVCLGVLPFVVCRKIHIDIIYFVRYYVDHANDYLEPDQDEWTSQAIYDELCLLFPGYMSIAYSLQAVNPNPSTGRDFVPNPDWSALYSESRSAGYYPPYN